MTVVLLKIACILMARVGISLVPQVESLIVTGPESRNASIGSQVDFQCFFHDIPSCPFHVQWKINSSDIGVLPMSKPPNITQNGCYENEITFGIVILYLLESQDIMWDNSNIVCVGRTVKDPNNIATSDSALLRIQGTLGKPPNLTMVLSTDSNSLIIGWNLPYTLNGVEILNFSINVISHSISDDSNLSPVEKYNVSGDMTSFVFSNIRGSCAVYNVSVQAVTLAGLGEPSYEDQAIFETAPKKLTPEDVTIFVSYVQENLSVTFTFNDSNCEAQQADMAGVVIYSATDLILSRKAVELMNLSYAEREFTVTLPSNIKHLEANATINLTNSDENKFTESMLITLNLYEVQDLVLHPIPSGIKVKCVFALNTENENCKVAIWCDDCSSEKDRREIELSPETTVTNLSTCELACNSTAYCFLAFDVYNSLGTLTSIPAVTKSDVPVTEASVCSVVTTEVPTKTGTPYGSTTTEQPANTPIDAGLIIGITVIMLITFAVVVFLCTCTCVHRTQERKKLDTLTLVNTTTHKII